MPTLTVRETVFQREDGRKVATITASEVWSVNLMRRLKEKYPDEVDLLENGDGSVFGHVPAKWMKLSPPRKVSEEQRAKAAERLRKVRK